MPGWVSASQECGERLRELRGSLEIQSDVPGMTFVIAIPLENQP